MTTNEPTAKIQTFDSFDSFISTMKAEYEEDVAEFNEYLKGTATMNLSLCFNSEFHATLSKKNQAALGVSLREVYLFKPIPIIENSHDFVVTVKFTDGTSSILALPFSPTCSTDYAGVDHDPQFSTKCLTSLLLTASDGKLPGFQVWNSLIKFYLVEQLPKAEQLKLINILD